MVKVTPRRTAVPWPEAAVAHPLVQIAFGIGTVWLLAYNYVLLRSAQAVHWNDFGKFYYATQNWESGSSLYAPTIATGMWMGSFWLQFLDMNPPHFHLLLVPLAKLSLQTSALIWLVVNLATAIASIAIVLRELQLRVARVHWLPFACLCLASVATGGNLLTGQCTGLLMLPMALAWRAARCDRWDGCGAWLGVLVSVKPFLGLFMPTLLLLGRWRALRSLCVSGAGCALLGVLVFGWRSYVEWFDALRDVSWVWAGMNGSIRAGAAKTLAWSPFLTPVALRPAWVTPLWIVCCAAVALVSARAVRRSIEHAFSITILASLLISPLGWTYYLWLAMPGCFALWRERMSPITWVGLLLLCVPLSGLAFGQPYALATVVVGSSYSWGTLALWLGVVTDPTWTGSYGRSMVRQSPVPVAATSNEPAAISTTA